MLEDETEGGSGLEGHPIERLDPYLISDMFTPKEEQE